MKAAVLHNIGDQGLDVRDDVTTIDPGPTDVRVRVRATGICHSDLSGMNGTLPAMAPGVMGHEGSGEVVAVGEQVRDLSAGDHVAISFAPPCGNCRSCLRGQPHLCAVHTVEAFTNPRFRVNAEPAFGMGGCGTFAEEVVVPRAGAVPVDPDVPFEIAALVGCGVMTGVGAVVNTAQVTVGSTVAVIGCGGVGISAIQGARVAGAAVIVAVDPVVSKHELARDFGATHTTTPEGLQELSQRLTGGEGFDYAFEVVGVAATIRAAYDAARRGGTAVVVGAGAADDMVEFSAQELFLDEKRLLGCFYGSADVRCDHSRMLELWRAGRLDLEGMVSRRLSLDEINDGLRALQEGKVVRQVVVFD